MKYLDRFINFIFSLFVLALSALVTLIAAGIVEYNNVSNSIGSYLFNNENRTITCIVSIIVFVMALKTTVFLSTSNRKKSNVVYVDTNNGKVQIAQDTIENTAKNAVKQYDCVKDAKARMMKAKKGIDIYMQLYVLNDTNIIELTSKAQDEVKYAVEGSAGVRVNNVDIQVKNISNLKAKVKGRGKEEKVEVKNESALEVPIFNTTAEEEEQKKQQQSSLIEVVPVPENEAQETPNEVSQEEKQENAETQE